MILEQETEYNRRWFQQMELLQKSCRAKVNEAISNGKVGDRTRRVWISLLGRTVTIIRELKKRIGDRLDKFEFSSTPLEREGRLLLSDIFENILRQCTKQIYYQRKSQSRSSLIHDGFRRKIDTIINTKQVVSSDTSSRPTSPAPSCPSSLSSSFEIVLPHNVLCKARAFHNFNELSPLLKLEDRHYKRTATTASLDSLVSVSNERSVKWLVVETGETSRFSSRLIGDDSSYNDIIIKTSEWRISSRLTNSWSHKDSAFEIGESRNTPSSQLVDVDDLTASKSSKGIDDWNDIGMDNKTPTEAIAQSIPTKGGNYNFEGIGNDNGKPVVGGKKKSRLEKVNFWIDSHRQVFHSPVAKHEAMVMDEELAKYDLDQDEQNAILERDGDLYSTKDGVLTDDLYSLAKDATSHSFDQPASIKDTKETRQYQDSTVTTKIKDTKEYQPPTTATTVLPVFKKPVKPFVPPASPTVTTTVGSQKVLKRLPQHPSLNTRAASTMEERPLKNTR